MFIIFIACISLLLMLGISLAILWGLGFLDIFYTFVQEGQIKTVMKGEDFSHFLPNVKGKILNRNALYPDPTKDDFDFVDSKIKLKNSLTKNPDPTKGPDDIVEVNNRPPLPFLVDLLGLYSVGLWPIFQVLWYKFGWNKWGKKDEKNPDVENEIIPRVEMVPSIFYQYPYPVCYKDAEIAGLGGGAAHGNETVNLLAIFTLAVTNPYTLLFRNPPPGSWYNGAIGYLERLLKQHAATQSFEELVKDKGVLVSTTPSGKKIAHSALADFFLREEVLEELHTNWGITITSVNLWSVDLSERNQRLREALLADEIESRLGDAAITKATKQGKALVITGTARAKAVKEEAKALKSASGRRLRELQAFEATRPTIIAGNSAVPLVNLPATPAPPASPPTSSAQQGPP